MKRVGNIAVIAMAAVICLSIGCERESSNGDVDTVAQETPSVPTPTVAQEPPSAPYTGYLEEEIPPCTPVEGSSIDPCDPDAPTEYCAGCTRLGDEPFSIREVLDGSPPPSRVPHLVVRGTYLPGTVRCTAGSVFRQSPYLPDVVDYDVDHRSIKCYIDVRANAYVLGSGSSALSILVLGSTYRDNRYITFLKKNQTEQDLIEEEMHRLEGLINYLHLGREHMLFIGPDSDLSSEAWLLMEYWDVQRREDGIAIAVHRERNEWRRYQPHNYLTHRSVLEMELPAFTQAVTMAHQDRITEYGGRIGADPSLPMLVTDTSQLRQYFISVGAYDHPDGPPAQPPPSCKTVVPGHEDNPGLMQDCVALLVVKDALRGAGTLHWSAGKTIGSWDGVSTGGTPTRVTKVLLPNKGLVGTIPAKMRDLSELTHLDLSGNSLAGDIPREIGWLDNLEEIRLSGNSLTGCIPYGLKDLTANDLSSLNLLYCPPAPSMLGGGETEDVTVPLEWTAVANTTKYRIEYSENNPYRLWWRKIVDITATSYIVELYCNKEYQFRVSAYGDGTTYSAVWSDPTEALTRKTNDC